MKKTKLLMPILGVTATLGAVVPTIVACNKDDAKGIDDSNVAKQARTKDLGGGKSGFVFEGFKNNSGTKTEDLTAYAESDAIYWSGAITCQVNPVGKNVNTFNVTMVLDAGALAGLANYQITLKIGTGEGDKFKPIYQATNFYGLVVSTLVEPEDSAARKATWEYQLHIPFIEFEGCGAYTGFKLNGYAEYSMFDNVVVYLYNTDGTPVDEENYTTRFAVSDYLTGDCYLQIWCDHPGEAASKTYKLGVQIENLFEDPIVLLPHDQSKEYTLTFTA